MVNGDSHPDLLQLSPAGGCGCKLPLKQMREFMAGIEGMIFAGGPTASVVIGGADRDDAALYEISPGALLAVTTDFGTPVSADIATWGRIAAQNALSDIFAMGARPLLALSVMAVPDWFGVDLMTRLTRGATTALSEASAPLVGGHTVRSPVPLFGLSVVGQVDADRAMLLRNARPGQRLVLTKPLGTGIVVAGARAGVAPAELMAAAENLMSRSNRIAAEIATEHGVRAATDVTGFGLMGHLQNMMGASGCSARLWRDAVPVLAGAMELLEEHAVVPNSAENNLFALDEHVGWAATPFAWRLTVSDPQTSGGLLLAVDEAAVAGLVAACSGRDVDAHVIGVVEEGTSGRVVVEA
ncbi:selenide, water dikinase SelD [Micromonospora sp. AMSO12t]|uniref:selenide, water dikinase SelD n=1 Tax=Micromonospora sp. AMSO12t TaxID=2650410 RepID=UPI00124B267D|nr:selenide, water dikinase SelD [Micromonospora sp. AMSO12t]KAB1159030.1 selenide, water dikinase SelD [Micromonospora sp. AMSO12t]